jgi:hypothetical protein
MWNPNVFITLNLWIQNLQTIGYNITSGVTYCWMELLPASLYIHFAAIFVIYRLKTWSLIMAYDFF